MRTNDLESRQEWAGQVEVSYAAQGHLRMMPEDIEALCHSDARYRTIVDLAPIGIVLTDQVGLILIANPAFQKLVGYSEDELHACRFTDITHPDDVQISLEAVRQTLAGRAARRPLDKRYIRKDGVVVWASVSLFALMDTNGQSHGLIAMQQDITERREIEETLRQREDLFHQMFESTRTIQLLLDPETGAIVEANPAACAFYGASADDLRSTNIYNLNVLSADIVAAEMARAEREGRGYFNHRHRLWSGEIRDIKSYSTPVEIDGRPLLYSIIHDVTDQKLVEAQLIHQSLHDGLTGLPNRLLLQDRLEQAILRARREGLPVALLILDLNRFKDINHSFGHDVGDLLLQQIGPRLREVVRQTNAGVRLFPANIARLGGDQFAIILPGADEPEAIAVTGRLLQVLNAPFLAGEHRLVVGASIGIALFPRQGQDPIGLLRRAESAMYLAKQAYGSFVVYDASQDVHTPERQEMAGDLREAIEHGGLHLRYQPEITCLTGLTTRVEALTRWLHPRRGMISPADFIPLAEQTGVIGQLTIWVLREALQQCRQWRVAGKEVGIAVNLSARSLSDPQLTEMIEQAVRIAGAEFDWLDVEITEGAIMADVDRSMRVLQHLCDLGIRVSVDDFGTGYSSLTYLRRLPVHAVKIDRSFVVEMALNEEDAIIVRSVVDLAHNLGLDVVAEGVEDSEAYDMLVDMGCQVAQGYYFSRPLSGDGISEWLAAERSDAKV